MTSEELNTLKLAKSKVLDGLKAHRQTEFCNEDCPYFREHNCHMKMAEEAEWLISQMDKRIQELDDLVETVCLGAITDGDVEMKND